MIGDERVILKGVQRRWVVYDRLRGSIPIVVPNYGTVQPNEGFADEAEAQTAVEQYAEFLKQNPNPFT